MNTGFLGPAVATVLTACGIETFNHSINALPLSIVATVLTACGIETGSLKLRMQLLVLCCNSTYRLRY